MKLFLNTDRVLEVLGAFSTFGRNCLNRNVGQEQVLFDRHAFQGSPEPSVVSVRARILVAVAGNHTRLNQWHNVISRPCESHRLA